MSASSILCQLCSDIALCYPSAENPIREYSTIRELSEAANTGCPFCRLICATHTEQHDKGRSRDPVLWTTEDYGHSAIRVFYQEEFLAIGNNIKWSCSAERTGFSASLSHYLGGVFAHPDSVVAQGITGRSVSLDPTSVGNVQLARSWLRRCLHEHSKCPSASPSSLPTRLLDIGEYDNGPQVSLFIPDAPVRDRYAALSYCWGSSNAVKLTSSTFEHFRHGIAIQTLPRTIQDAIRITRSLGLRYLWVDALCIVQDSKIDWQQEAARMGEVYSRALVTVQAAVADNSDVGCFGKRHQSELPLAQLKLRTMEGNIGPVFMRQRPLVTPMFVEPLHRRGWTLQEALLAPRILCFGTREMSWECATCHEGGGGSQLFDSGHYVGLPKHDRWQRALTWSNIVREYSTRTLSFGSDKLPALSGLAKFLAATRSDDLYLAGLWKSELPGCLYWATTGSGSRPNNYLAPSWSWASLQSPVDDGHTSEDTSAVCKVVDVWTTPSGIDSYGEVSAGCTTLCTSAKVGWRVFDDCNAKGDHDVQYFYDENVAKNLKSSDFTFGLKLGLVGLDVVEVPQPLNVPVPSSMVRLSGSEGLVLAATNEGTYRRIGYYLLDSGKESWFDDCEECIIRIL